MNKKDSTYTAMSGVSGRKQSEADTKKSTLSGVSTGSSCFPVEKKNVAIIGSSSWGTCLARICAKNAQSSPYFNSEVRIWPFDELVNGESLKDIINKKHENPKYLPGVQLPNSVVAVSDLVAVGGWADVLVFALTTQTLARACQTLKGKVKLGAYALSVIKGIHAEAGKEMTLLSDLIRSNLGIECAVLMGANMAQEVAKDTFCEATIGSKCQDRALELKALLQTENFRLVTTPDETSVELCAALKNVVAIAAGVCDGLGYGENTKVAVIRLGLAEMVKLTNALYQSRGIAERTFFESCGVSDLLTTCYGGQNRKLAGAFAKTGKPLAQLEDEMLSGQKLQGPQIASEVYAILSSKGQLKEYPLMEAVHLICSEKLTPDKLIGALRDHPAYK